jgi:hypothetical protein
MFMMMSKRCIDRNSFDFDKRNNSTCEHIEKVLNEERKASIKVQRDVPRDHGGVFEGFMHLRFKVSCQGDPKKTVGEVIFLN